MGELAVLGIFVGLWCALSTSEQLGRDHAEAVLGWVLVALSVLLAFTAVLPDSVTESGDAPCRGASCSQSGTEGLPNRNTLTGDHAPGTSPIPGTNPAPGVAPTPGRILQPAG